MIYLARWDNESRPAKTLQRQYCNWATVEGTILCFCTPDSKSFMRWKFEIDEHHGRNSVPGFYKWEFPYLDYLTPDKLVIQERLGLFLTFENPFEPDCFAEVRFLTDYPLQFLEDVAWAEVKSNVLPMLEKSAMKLS